VVPFQGQTLFLLLGGFPVQFSRDSAYQSHQFTVTADTMHTMPLPLSLSFSRTLQNVKRGMKTRPSPRTSTKPPLSSSRLPSTSHGYVELSRRVGIPSKMSVIQTSLACCFLHVKIGNSSLTCKQKAIFVGQYQCPLGLAPPGVISSIQCTPIYTHTQLRMLSSFASITYVCSSYPAYESTSEKESRS